MIKLSKGPEPEVLKKNKETWTLELMSALEERNEKKLKVVTKRYNHPEVKTALKQETHQKCAYCEAFVTDVAHGDIEHVTAKSLHREKTFQWENLTFACQVCNQNKSNKEDVIDPYNENPDEHIFFAGAFAKGRSLRGIRTVAELKLNRIALIESRNREIERYADKIEKIFVVEDDDIKKLLFNSMVEDLDEGFPEFIAACRMIVAQYK